MGELETSCRDCGHPVEAALVSTAHGRCHSCSGGAAQTTLARSPRPSFDESRFRAMAAKNAALSERYELGPLLGYGAMGAVFSATRRTTGQQLAIKFLTQLDDREVRDRFMREGRMMGRLDHPNVVRIHDLDEADDQPYLVTELLTGGTLRERLARGRVPLPAAVAIALDCLCGLEACHAAGIVHRDIKPENLLFGQDGCVRVTDFGIARSAATTLLTQTGTPLGTPRYMAPEQVRGEPASPATDIHAVGVVLHEMLAGRPPYEAEEVYALLRQITDDEPPDLTLQAGVPAALAATVQEALAKRPEDRPPTARALADLLTHRQQAGWRHVSRRLLAPMRRRRPALVGLALVLVLGSAVTWVATRPPSLPLLPPLPSNLPTGDPGSALRVTALRARLEKEPGDTGSLKEVIDVLVAAGRPEEAEPYARHAVLVAPRQVQPHADLGRVLRRMGHAAEAEAELTRVLEIDPTHGEALRHLAEMQFETGRPEAAVASWRRAIQIKPIKATYLRLGAALLDLRRPKEAQAPLEAAVRLGPNAADAHAYLGLSFHMQGRTQEAEACYRRALQLEPAHPLVRRQLTTFKKR